MSWFTVARGARYLMDDGWKFSLDSGGGSGFGPECKADAFPIDLNDKQCQGLSQVGAQTEDECARSCCNSETCEVYQWCNTTNCMPSKMTACWVGAMKNCGKGAGWVSKGRNVAPTPPSPGGGCHDPRCTPQFDDSAWRTVDVPHDFVVEGNFSSTGDKSHGYLPYNKGWYRKHFVVPTGLSPSDTIYLEFDGTQANTVVYLNGVNLGGHASGYTPYRFRLDGSNSSLKMSGENVLVVFVDATHPDGWWYDGGGIYRHVWLTTQSSVHVMPWGLYTPAVVTSTIYRHKESQQLRAESASVKPQVELESAAAEATAVTVLAEVFDSTGTPIGKSTVSGSVPGGGNTTLQLPDIVVEDAALWHVGTLNGPEQPLYTTRVTVSAGSTVLDVTNTTFGIRQTNWSADTGFWLNGERVKILGNANHQDFAGVGVAVPDVLQVGEAVRSRRFSPLRSTNNAARPGAPHREAARNELKWLAHRAQRSDEGPSGSG
eukprot:m.244559 g.244559  ORF g.244559 m.244559 type:complete len:488 (-) comp15845_c0_seq5:1583-3046(-)